jgi:hypothetical protein
MLLKKIERRTPTKTTYKMLTIPLKANSGYIKLHANGTIEIKKLDSSVLIPKRSINRMTIYPEGRVTVFLQNTIYEYSIQLDRINIPKINELFTTYFSKESESDMKLSFDIMDEYKKTLKMIGEQLLAVCRFNVDISSEIDLQFKATNNTAAEMELSIQELSATNETLRNEINSINHKMIIAVILIMVAFAYQKVEVPTFTYAEVVPLSYTILLSELLPPNMLYDNSSFLDPF